jgi:hypothetical protein
MPIRFPDEDNLYPLDDFMESNDPNYCPIDTYELLDSSGNAASSAQLNNMDIVTISNQKYLQIVAYDEDLDYNF